MSVTTAEIVHLWRQANRQMRGLIRQAVGHYDLPPMAFPLLRHIQDEPGITVSELARRLSTAKSHVSNTIEQLVKEGLVERQSDPADQRMLRLYLSEAATKQLEDMARRTDEAWMLVFEEFPEAELEDVARFLNGLLRALERANDKLTAASGTRVE